MVRHFNTRRLLYGGKNRFGVLNIWIFFGGIIIMLILLYQRDATTADILVTPLPRPRIFCVIVTYAFRHEHAAIHIKKTWARHCDRYVFISDDVHIFLEPVVFRNIRDKWQRIRAHLEYIYKYHFYQGDWFLYANDDNFVVVENLRHMLQSYSSEELIYFGCKMRSKGLIYMYDDSGIVLSAASLKRFVLEALINENLCSSHSRGSEAAKELGRCLSNVNVIAGDSRDEFKKHRFLPFEVDIHLGGQMNASVELHKYFLEHSYHPISDMNLPVSLRSICFHLMLIPITYDLYYFTENVHIFGASQKWDLENLELEIKHFHN
ncbi:glycoprotein-N-acetylgalactosamine 3-beta-galactosyltransferase 1 isoform X1 [Drosophila guanche]|uniref:N-acetylgalactosaminide beta-1,3-galactosyltransferase n=1 Tax=Drosophila guanche TaxID=7266 RepID=A0A3B0KAI6_DROGU|nr:glycoprotein-N-acetylgalactosamine 3-beta-galactosyltransferase 1 isoform X1 [Drosophila guanche]SPP89732.1 blast:Glycoprotein-N-acetylgalactosamine 3-beta-galactosyltransferase 1 [Drosophila guanche]